MRVNEPGSPYQEEFHTFAGELRARIIRSRKMRGLTQEDMQSHGLSLRQYQRIESGETENITLSNLYRIARALRMEPAELLPRDSALK